MWTVILWTKAFNIELKSCCMLCYSMLWHMRIYEIVCNGMIFQCYGMRFNGMVFKYNTMVYVVKYMLELTVITTSYNNSPIILTIWTLWYFFECKLIIWYSVSKFRFTIINPLPIKHWRENYKRSSLVELCSTE